MAQIKLHCISKMDDIASPLAGSNLSIESPALSFFTDFHQVKPLVIESNLPAVEVQLLMKKAHVRLKFVLDDDNHFIGIVTNHDLSDEKIIKKVSEGFKREEIPLTEFMTAKESLKAMDFNDIECSRMKDVIDALKESSDQYFLVIDTENHKIRGFFSASDISRKLHLPINRQKTSSFHEVFTALS